MVAFGISALVFAVIAIFVPLFGIFLAGLSGVLAWLAAGRAYALGGAAVIINFINITLLSPGYMLVAGIEASQRTPEQGKMFSIWAIVLFIQIAAVVVFLINLALDNLGNSKRSTRKKQSRPSSDTSIDAAPIQTRQDTVSPLTKVLVGNIQGKKKIESTFWTSTFKDNDPNDIALDGSAPHKERLNYWREYRKVLSSITVVTAVLIFTLFLRPDLFSFLNYANIYSSISESFPDKSKNELNSITTAPPHPISKPQYSRPQIPPPSNPPQGTTRSPAKATARKSYVYSWKEADGNWHFSNTTYPNRNDTLRIQTEIDTYKNATPIKMVENEIYLPVVIRNNGNIVRTSLMLDTNSKITAVKSTLLKQVRANFQGSNHTSITNGKEIKGKLIHVDSIKVGPHILPNFKVIGQNAPVSAEAGILGMDFLREHPFTLDVVNRLIIWQ